MYGVDWDGPPSTEDDEQQVTVPSITCPLTDDDLHRMQESINPLAFSSNFGIDLFATTLDFVYRHIQ